MKTTRDNFLNGALVINQPADGFRAGVDAVLLAAACPAKPGDAVLELGCGVGTASLCLARRVDVAITGVELQTPYAALAHINSTQNALDFKVFCADLRHLPAALRQRSFDHVIANPPYFSRAHGTSASDTGRDTALGGDTALRDWLTIASKRLRPKGWLTMIQRIDRLPDILRDMPKIFGSITALPISARAGRAPHLVIVRARKEGRAPFKLSHPFVMHSGAVHTRDADDYTADASAILRLGAAMNENIF